MDNEQDFQDKLPIPKIDNKFEFLYNSIIRNCLKAGASFGFVFLLFTFKSDWPFILLIFALIAFFTWINYKRAVAELMADYERMLAQENMFKALEADKFKEEIKKK